MSIFCTTYSCVLNQKSICRNGMSFLVIQIGTQFTALGKIELTFDGGTVTAAESLLVYTTAMDYPLTDAVQAAAAEVQNALDAAEAAQAEILDQILCNNEIRLRGVYIYWDYAEPRVVETNYGDFVTDAFAVSAEVFAAQNDLLLPVIAVTNGGGILATLPMGQVTYGDVLNAFNHGNMVEV